MYHNILIATDGSALAGKAVAHGLGLAKSVGAKVTAVIVETPFNVMTVPESRSRQMTEAFPWETAPRYLLRDRDTSYGPAFRAALKR